MIDPEASGGEQLKTRFVRYCLGGLIVAIMIVPCVAIGTSPQWHGPPDEPCRKPATEQGDSWTIALFVNGDNNLEKYWGEVSRPALESVPASDGLTIVAMVDWIAENGTYVYEISGGVTTEVATYAEENFGDGATFTRFLTEVVAQYPSDHLAVICWDHGYAWRYISDDETSGGDRITMPELQSAIEDAGVYIDVLAFDACNMAALEVAYQMSLTGCVGLMVASEESIPLNGYPYDLMFTPLAEDPSRSPEQVVSDMVAGWGEYYAPETWAKTNCLSATDVSIIGDGVIAFQDWTEAMHSNLDEYAWNYKLDLRAALSAWQTCEHVDIVDLGVQILADEAITDAALVASTEAMIGVVESAVLAYWNADEVAAFRGLTLYWGLGGDWTTYNDAYSQVAYAIDTGWWNFLNDYN